MPGERRCSAIWVPSKWKVAMVTSLIGSQSLAQLCQQIPSSCILTTRCCVNLKQSQRRDAGHIAAASDQPGGNRNSMHLVILSIIRGDLVRPDVTNAPKRLFEFGSVVGVHGAHHPVACTQSPCSA